MSESESEYQVRQQRRRIKAKALLLGSLLSVMVGSPVVGLGFFVTSLLQGVPILDAMGLSGTIVFIAALISSATFGLSVPLLVIPAYFIYPGSFGQTAATLLGLIIGLAVATLLTLAWHQTLPGLDLGAAVWLGPGAIYGALAGYLTHDIEQHEAGMQ